ncbi:Glycosyl transferases group 1 [Sphingomonas laterariae]|uniref:Glycosyl transferases group 1 n=1 Tax=Edaphosphingomonas laterariae TaxID=861865 RepID=A0A239IL66_9SPHN|nr:glycosyltransferase family 4 protein [Sphingomonas laterariae]SNS93968.1 Glycosyl transferases group 1 [Sphingomonas laterariae]
MSRKLVVAVRGDFTPLNCGYHRRTADLVAFLAGCFPGTAVYSHYEHPVDPWTDEAIARFEVRFPGVDLILDHAPRAVRLLGRLKNAALAFAPAAAPAILRWTVGSATANYRKMAKEADRYLFVMNTVDTYAALNGFRFNSLVETHDIKFANYCRRAGRSAAGLRAVGKLRSEVAVLERACGIIAISPVDASIFRTLVTETPTFWVPSYDEPDDAAPAAASHVYDHDLLFVGSDNIFNVTGICTYLADNRVWLKRRRIAIAGRVCATPEVVVLARSWPGLDLLGFVDDLAPVYAGARAVLSPVEGTGLKIKMVDALAHGRPVLASTHSRDGLPPGFEHCVLPLDRETVEKLLDDPEALAAASRAARDYHARFLEAGDRRKLKDFIAAMLN